MTLVDLPGYDTHTHTKSASTIAIAVHSTYRHTLSLTRNNFSRAPCLYIHAVDCASYIYIYIYIRMTKVPVGDQPGDIETRIREMVMAYIKHETCVILAVSPANADLANSEALKMARQADPSGDRTLGVLTKLDIMDRGTDAAKALRNQIVPLKLGYVGVVNRCQADVNGNKSVQRAIQEEEQYFETHASYNADDEVRSRCGTQKLALELNSILVSHILQILPQLRDSLVEKMHTAERKLLSLGNLYTNAKEGGSALLLKLLTEFCANSRKILDGETCASFEEVSEEIKGGARVFFIYRDIFAKSIERNFEEHFEVSDAEIRTVILNSSGIKGACAQ